LKSNGDELRKQLKQFNLLRVITYLSLLVALGTTAFLAVSLFLTGYAPLAGPSTAATQTAFANATVATTTTVYSYSSTTTPSGGYSIIAALAMPNLLTYDGFIAVLSWTVFGAALIWRGHVRSVWGQSRFSYDTFRLLVKMRGAQTRVKLMRSLNSPKNKLQLATALGIDWKAVDKHVQVLERNGLIHATSTNGTATFYEVSEKGKNLMQVLEQLIADNSGPE
jgi:predicted transcriptional regulator